jgi:hypothetical protein
VSATPDPSAWRNFPKPRKLRKLIPHKRPTPAILYGYPASVIAQACAVKLSTAYAYKAGRRKPGASVVKLWLLYRDRQVLTPKWRGWLVKSECIVDPEGNETSRSLLRMYQMMLQYAHDLARRTGDEREIERFYELLKAA